MKNVLINNVIPRRLRAQNIRNLADLIERENSPVVGLGFTDLIQTETPGIWAQTIVIEAIESEVSAFKSKGNHKRKRLRIVGQKR